MALTFEPTAPWHLLATGLVLVVAVALLARGAVDLWLVFARRWLFRAVILLAHSQRRPRARSRTTAPRTRAAA